MKKIPESPPRIQQQKYFAKRKSISLSELHITLLRLWWLALLGGQAPKQLPGPLKHLWDHLIPIKSGLCAVHLKVNSIQKWALYFEPDCYLDFFLRIFPLSCGFLQKNKLWEQQKFMMKFWSLNTIIRSTKVSIGRMTITSPTWISHNSFNFYLKSTNCKVWVRIVWRSISINTTKL